MQLLVRLYRPAVWDNSLVVTVMPIVMPIVLTCQLYNREGVLTVVFLPLAQLSRLHLGCLVTQLKQEGLAQHLKENFDTGILTPFPTTTSGKKNKRKHIVITLYCVCSLPAEYDSMMVQCEQCDSWYHYRCVGIKRVNPRLLFVHSVRRIFLLAYQHFTDFFFLCALFTIPFCTSFVCTSFEYCHPFDCNCACDGGGGSFFPGVGL